MARTKQTARAGKKAQNQKQKSKGNKGIHKQIINQNKKFARKDYAKRKAARTKKAKLAINESTAKIPSANLDTLKARAARFGEISSKTLVKVSLMEKKQQRVERFKDGTETDSEIKSEVEVNGNTEPKVNGNKKARKQKFKKNKAGKQVGAKEKIKIPSADLDKLKARAARFGEISSKTLKKVSLIEKKQQRSDRFKSSTETDSETKGEPEAKGIVKMPSVDLDKLKSRAARFGEISSKTLKKVSLIEQKQQRADRFKDAAVTDAEVTTDTSVANGKEA